MPWNLLQYSEDFSNAYWTKSLGTLTANVINAPNGTLTADLFTKTSAVNTVSQVSRSTNVYSQTGIHTLSVYAKQNVGNLLLLRLDNDNNTANAQWNFSTKSFTNIGANIISSSFEELSNGWFRLIVTGNVTSTTWSVSIANLFANSTNDSVYIWGAQIVEGTTAQTYLPTTDRLNFPRLDYTYGSCPALLLEPQRTNLITYSQEFDNAAWTKINTTITANSTTSPDGTTNADTITDNSTNGSHFVRASAGWSTTQQTATVYAKAGTSSKVYIMNSSAGIGVFADLSTETIVVSSGFTGAISNVGNGWYRITATHTAAASQSLAIGLFTGTSTFSYAGSGSTAFIYGAQLEAGAYPSTYIPTTSASATRIADSFTKSGISSLINSVEGVLYCQFRVLVNENITKAIILNDGTINNRLSISVYANAVFMSLTVGGVSQVFSSSTITPTNLNKFAFKYKANDFGLWVNGTKVLTSTSGSTFSANTLNQLASIQADGTSAFNGFIQQLAIFNTSLSDSDLVSLTT